MRRYLYSDRYPSQKVSVKYYRNKSIDCHGAPKLLSHMSFCLRVAQLCDLPSLSSGTSTFTSSVFYHTPHKRGRVSTTAGLVGLFPLALHPGSIYTVHTLLHFLYLFVFTTQGKIRPPCYMPSQYSMIRTLKLLNKLFILHTSTSLTNLGQNIDKR